LNLCRKSPNDRKTIALRWALAALLACLAGSAAAQDSEYESEINREYAIKAAYLYQFGRYVQWPQQAFDSADSPLVIGVLGDAPFGGVLEEIAGTKKIEGRSILVRKFASMADYTPCHILFIASSVSPREKTEAIRKLQGTPTLIVGEEPGFAEHGGMINFFLEENRVRFEINAEAAKHDQLKISSKLLSLAKIVPRY